MNIVQLILCLVCPPLAVLDKGVSPVLITSVATLLGWFPGVLVALVIIYGDKE